MRIHIDVECTPQEARQFFGLPDLTPLNEALMKEIEARMLRAVESTDPEAMLRRWLPGSIDAWQQLMRAFTNLGGSGPTPRSGDEGEGGGNP